MRIIGHIALGYLMVLFLGAIWSALPFSRAVPDVIALVAVYLGLTARERLAPATAGAVAVGYLADLLLGTPRGLLAFAAGALCFAGHMVQGRLLVRGVIFTVLFSAITAAFSGLFNLGVRASLDPHFAIADELGVFFWTVVLTGLVGPLVFRLCRMVDARLARTERERDLVLEGFVP